MRALNRRLWDCKATCICEPVTQQNVHHKTCLNRRHCLPFLRMVFEYLPWDYEFWQASTTLKNVSALCLRCIGKQILLSCLPLISQRFSTDLQALFDSG